MVTRDNADELALIVEEIGADVIRGDCVLSRPQMNRRGLPIELVRRLWGKSLSTVVDWLTGWMSVCPICS